MENIGVKCFVDELRKLNPGFNFRADDTIYPAVVITDVAAQDIVLPEGYYLDGDSELTNKHNTTNGSYEFFELLSESEYSN